jgi:hypothetical protein
MQAYLQLLWHCQKFLCCAMLMLEMIVRTGRQIRRLVGVQGEDGDIEVTELPLRKWTQDYKEWLDSMLKPDKDAKDQTCYISDYKCASLHWINDKEFNIMCCTCTLHHQLHACERSWHESLICPLQPMFTRYGVQGVSH